MSQKKEASLFCLVKKQVMKTENITVNEAGRKGGLSLLNKRGNNHFSKIGKKGQEMLRQRYPGMASVWGRLGGRPKKKNL
jgi:hypothetical protein